MLVTTLISSMTQMLWAIVFCIAFKICVWATAQMIIYFFYAKEEFKKKYATMYLKKTTTEDGFTYKLMTSGEIVYEAPEPKKLKYS